MVVSDGDDHLTGYHHFAEKVNRKLRAGYQLHGQPIAVDRAMCQAMIRPAAPDGQSWSDEGNTTHFFPRAAVAG